MPPMNAQPQQHIDDKSNYIRERIEAAKQRKLDAAELAELWSLNFHECPVERQYTIWLRRYAKNVIADGIERTAEWFDNEAQKAEAAGEELSKPLAELTAYATGVMIKRSGGEVTLNGRKYTRKPVSEEKAASGFSVEDEDDELA